MITYAFDELGLVVHGHMIDTAMLAGEADIDGDTIAEIRLPAADGRMVTLRQGYDDADPIYRGITEALRRTRWERICELQELHTPRRRDSYSDIRHTQRELL